MSIHVLVVDNDPIQSRTAELNLNKLGYKVTACNSGAEAIGLLLGKKGDEINLVLLDLSMPEISGIDVLRKVTPHRPDIPIIIHTAHGDVQHAVEALQEGAVDFIEKQDGVERLKTCIENVIRINRLQHEVHRLKRSSDGQVHFSDITGSSDAIEKTKTLAERAAQSNIPVLIKGESGVGKELFASAIHGSSARSGKPFIAVNCAAIPENLVESVLFGHEKGSFTGAIEKTIGKFREADGGTLFLDEIGELRLDVQVKLLRALQENEVEPVGAGKPVKVSVRLISATNRNLKDEVAKGSFREDLYYRINVFPFTIPSLKERKGDIIELLEHFADIFSAQENKSIRGISDEATKILCQYSWPGNVRQLENAVYRAVVLCDGNMLGVDDFQHIISAMDRTHKEAKNAAIPEDGFIALFDEKGEFKNLHDFEGELLQKALGHYKWKISEVSRRLNIGRSTLYRKIEEFGIVEEKHKDNAA